VKTVMTLTWYRHFKRNGGLNQKGQRGCDYYKGNICSTSGTRLTNPVTNHVRRRDNGVTPGSPEE